LSTADSWLVKQASEHVYRRHRDFESEIPLRLKLISDTNDPRIKDSLISEFKIKYKNFATDYSEINKLFTTLHQYTDLYKTLPIIETILLSYEINQDKLIHKHFAYDKILEQRLTDNREIVKDSLVLDNSEQISPITKDSQTKLVSNVNKVFKRCNEMEETFKLTPMQEFIFNFKSILEKQYEQYLIKTGNENSLNDYPNYIVKIINKSVIQGTLFAIDEKTDFTKLNSPELLQNFIERISEKNIIPTSKTFIDGLLQSIRRIKDTQNKIKIL